MQIPLVKGSFLVRFLAISTLFILSWAEGRPSSESSDDETDPRDSEWRESQLSKVKVVILNELGLHLSAYQAEHTETLPKSNISAAEYKRAYGEYMRRVRIRNLEEKGLTDYGHRNRRKNSKRMMQIFNPESIHTYDNVETRLDFNVNLNLEGRFHLRVRRAVIELPDGCFYFDLEMNETLSGEVEVTDKLTSWVMNQQKTEDGDFHPFGITLFCYPKQVTKGQQQQQQQQQLSEPYARREDLLMTSLKVVSTSLAQGSKIRTKRSTYSLKNYESHPSVRSRDCERTRHGKTCCRGSMKINFEDLHIRDLILEPKEFDAHICNGRCNARRVPFATTHAMLQHTLHQTKRKNEIPRPCCAPTKLRHLDVLHTVPGTDTLKITILANAIVEECSCS